MKIRELYSGMEHDYKKLSKEKLIWQNFRKKRWIP